MSTDTLLNILVSICIPAGFLYLIFALDLFGTGKGRIVLLSAAWGAFGAFALMRVVLQRILVPIFGTESVQLLYGPVIEEVAKALILIYLVGRPSFRYLVDGAVYGFAAGIGFAVSENLFHGSHAAVVDILSRVLSTTLMHATASGLVGIALGRMRRATQSGRIITPVVGIGLAMIIHVLFNNVNALLQGGPLLLLMAIGFGAVGAVLIAYLINQGLADEKRRFSETLTAAVGVSGSERRAIQGLGGDAVEAILKELGAYFGEDKVPLIRRVLVIQANIGILNNNLRGAVSPRLREAWEAEIKELRAESDTLRKQLGTYVMAFLRGVFPEEDTTWAEEFSQGLIKTDPTQINRFDMFMNASAKAGTMSVDELEDKARMLARAEIFKDVSQADLENLSRAVTESTFASGNIIFDEGDEGDTLFMLKQGRINLYKRDSHGGEKLLRTVSVGDVIGELALLDGSPRSARARADGEVVALRLRREHFYMFISSRPKVLVALLTFLANRVRDTTIALETSIAWATSIAKGNYTEAHALGMMAPKADVAVAGEALATISQREGDHAVSKDTAVAIPIQLGGAFSKVAAILEEREKSAPKIGGMWAKLGKDGGS